MAGIPLGSSFDFTSALPLDSRAQVADETARDAIPSGVRWIGMQVHCVAEEKTYALVGGITNGDWQEAGGGGGGIAGVRTISTNPVTLTADDLNTYIRVDASGGHRTITLPAASADTIGKVITFKRVSNEVYNISIVPAGADTIDGGTSESIPFTYGTLRIVGATATEWEII